MKDWQLPDFSSQQIPFSAPVNQVPRATLDTETYTHPKDFAVIHRLLQPEAPSLTLTMVKDEGFVGVREAVARVIYEEAADGEGVEQKSSVSQRLVLHKSCSTHDLEEQARPDGIHFLKSCFSTVANDDLSEILERCEGDVEWAANILLDAGYEYNECSLQPTPQTPRVTAATPRVIIQPQPQTPGPLALTQLCHQHLKPSQAFTNSVQEKFGETSVQRLNSISEFQRQRSSSSITESGLQPQRSRESTSSLDLAPNSPEADVFYSPLEGPVSPRFPQPLSRSSTATPGALGGDGSRVPSVGGPCDGMSLTLSPSLAQQLIALFGPVGFHISAGEHYISKKLCLH